MYKDEKFWIATDQGEPLYLLPRLANRHGIITGASGTGKTITMKVMAESFSAAGVPVFMADVKGDVAGICKMGEDSEGMQKRIKLHGLEPFQYKGFPTCFWDIYGKSGHHLRTTVSDMGPILLSKLMNLSDVQTEVLNVVFKIADEAGLLLIDIKDLKAMLKFVADHSAEFEREYGKLSPQSISAIQRNVVSLESQGADIFFGEPMLDLNDLFRCDSDGRGYINVLHSVELALNQTLYSAFMLWLLAEIYENLPEVGDPEKPRAVFFFDEAHMIFDNAPKVLLDKVEQVVRLVRSKGVGIYFVSQSPSDIPEKVLAQLSNKVQHSLRAYTPKEQKAVRAAAEGFRVNPAFNTEKAILELSTGEAVVSFLDESGAPSIARRAWILPPQSFMGPISMSERAVFMAMSGMHEKYGETVDNESAFEILSERAEKAAYEAEEAKRAAEEAKLAEQQAKEEAKAQAAAEKQAAKEALAAEKAAQKEAEKAEKEAAKAAAAKQKAVNRVAGNVAAATGRSVAKSAAKSITGKSTGLAGSIASTLGGSVGREVGQSIIRGLFGTRG